MKLFIFDCGEVILNNVDTFVPFAELIGIPHEELLSDYAFYEMPLMDGYMKVEDYYRHLEAKYRIRITDDPFARFFNPSLNLGMLSNVQKLRNKGYRCVVGSNTFAPHWDKILKMDGNPLGCFDALYPSHLVHLSKPEPAFFRYICKNENIAYEDAALIDDRKENTDAAKPVGLTVLEYSGPDKDKKAVEFFSRFL